MKIAIVHDELMRRGGGEQVALCFHYAFSDAPIYTIAYRPELTYEEFKKCEIITSWFQRISVNERLLKAFFFPMGIWAMRKLDLSKYDVVLMSSTYCAKYVKVRENTLVINYCHSPFRLAWYPESYKEYVTAKGLKKIALKEVIKVLRKIDYQSALRTDYFIANAKKMAIKINAVYKPTNEVAVINPPVEWDNFYVSRNIEDYFLVVCRLEYYKRVDIVIDAFNKLKLPLIVVGKGSQEESLKKNASTNISFKKDLSKGELAKLYSQCRALIFPQVEDYGITPLETIASGRPVIAFGEGGVLETMIPYDNDSLKATALFFYDQTSESLMAAIKLFDSLQFDSNFIRAYAMKFNRPEFIGQIKEFVVNRYLSNVIG